MALVMTAAAINLMIVRVGEDLTAFAQDGARKAFDADKHVNAIAFVAAKKMPKQIPQELLDGMPDIKEGQQLLISIMPRFDGSDSKDAFVGLLRMVAKDTGADEVVTVMEAWYLKMENDEEDVYKKYGSISEHPDATEHVLVTYMNKSNFKMLHADIAETAGVRYLEEFKEMDSSNVSGRFMDVFQWDRKEDEPSN